MPGLIIIFLIPAQQLQKSDAARGKEKVCADDDQHHRPEKDKHRGQRIFDCDGQIVAITHTDSPGRRHQPSGLRLPLSGAAIPQQLDGIGQMNLADRPQENQKKDNREQRDGGEHRHRRQEKSQRHLCTENFSDHKIHDLIQRDPQHKASAQGDQRHIKIFPGQGPGQMTLFHAQNVEDAKLLLPALDEKAVGVKQEDESEKPRDHASQKHGKNQRPISHHPLQPRI